MADTEEPQFNSLAERIAALNKQKNFSSPQSGNPTAAGKRPPPPPPPGRPSSQTPSQSLPAPSTNGHARPGPPEPAPPPLPRRTTTALADEDEYCPPLPGRNLAPPQPTRISSHQASPSLPPRRPSTQFSSARRNSNSSEISHVSTVSALSLGQTASSITSAGSYDTQPSRKLPPALDQAKLPPLPPTRREREAQAARDAVDKEAAVQARAPLLPSKSAPTVPRQMEPPPRPSLGPKLPSRPARPHESAQAEESAPSLPARRLPPPSANGFGRTPPPLPNGRPKWAGDDAPPPVPVSSRPSLAQIDAIASRPAVPSRPSAPQTMVASCLVCRDFSAPDAVAAQHPIHALPRHDAVGYLAHVLCDPFQSATDKARAIFTWCHHNIAYDVQGFFGGCIPRGLSPDETIFSGKAVCEGYAKIYQAIAERAGLECVVIGGHGKGYGFTPLRAGEPPPKRNATGHAWNAVRIDGGEWKLLDACWGAGTVGNQQYNKGFNPLMFTLRNDLFGLKHFPDDDRYFYRADGRVVSWEEYIVGPVGGEPAQLYSNAGQEGISEWTFSPRAKHIAVYSGEVVRFQFSKVCEHWDGAVHGKGRPYLLMLKIFGVDGRNEDLVPLDHDGFWWWVDVNARDLGAPGQTVSLFGLDTLDGRDARGVSKAAFLEKKGRCGMSWVGIAAWELV